MSTSPDKYSIGNSHRTREHNSGGGGGGGGEMVALGMDITLSSWTLAVSLPCAWFQSNIGGVTPISKIYNENSLDMWIDVKMYNLQPASMHPMQGNLMTI